MNLIGLRINYRHTMSINCWIRFVLILQFNNHSRTFPAPSCRREVYKSLILHVRSEGLFAFSRPNLEPFSSCLCKKNRVEMKGSQMARVRGNETEGMRRQTVVSVHFIFVTNLCYGKHDFACAFQHSMVTHKQEGANTCNNCGEMCPGFSAHYWR